jgi:hypothetical protein
LKYARYRVTNLITFVIKLHSFIVVLCVTFLHTDIKNSALISITFESMTLEVFKMMTLQKMVVRDVTPLRFLDS